MFICMFSWGALSALANIQIAHWCENPDPDDHSNLYIYIGLSFGSLIFVTIRTYFIIMSNLKLGRVLHKKIIKSLLYASLT